MASFSCGIVGLPNVGKSTLFNAVTKKGIQAENYPFCTIEPNVGVVTVPDHRVNFLVDIVKPQKYFYATIEFVDIAGLVKGASKGEGKGNQFLENIHHTNSIIHVVRGFDDDNIVHVHGKVSPIEDIQTINLELILADLDMSCNIISKLKKKIKADKSLQSTYDLFIKISHNLEQEIPLRLVEFSQDEQKILRMYRFLTLKEMIYVVNVSEDDLPHMTNDYVTKVKEFAAKENSSVITICAKIEDEIAQLDDDEAKDFLNDIGLKESGLDRLIKHAYDKLGLITYLTAGEVEVKAWTIVNGTKAPQAAAVIHTDFEKSFIRAEISKFNDISKLGSINAVKEAGLLSIEGKDYIIEDGDVVYFKLGKN